MMAIVLPYERGKLKCIHVTLVNSDIQIAATFFLPAVCVCLCVRVLPWRTALPHQGCWQSNTVMFPTSNWTDGSSGGLVCSLKTLLHLTGQISDHTPKLAVDFALRAKHVFCRKSVVFLCCFVVFDFYCFIFNRAILFIVFLWFMPWYLFVLSAIAFFSLVTSNNKLKKNTPGRVVASVFTPAPAAMNTWKWTPALMSSSTPSLLVGPQEQNTLLFLLDFFLLDCTLNWCQD